MTLLTFFKANSSMDSGTDTATSKNSWWTDSSLFVLLLLKWPPLIGSDLLPGGNPGRTGKAGGSSGRSSILWISSSISSNELLVSIELKLQILSRQGKRSRNICVFRERKLRERDCWWLQESSIWTLLGGQDFTNEGTSVLLCLFYFWCQALKDFEVIGVPL